MHGGTNPGAPKGNRNARRHGGYSAETMAAARYLKAVRGCFEIESEMSASGPKRYSIERVSASCEIAAGAKGHCAASSNVN